MLYNSLALQLGQGVDYHITLTQDLTEVMNADAAMELLYTDFNLDQNYDYQLLKKKSQNKDRDFLKHHLASFNF